VSAVLDTKARGLVTLGAQWFAIAQAVAAVAFATHKPATGMLVAVGIAALAGGVALGFLCYFCWRVWAIREQPAVSPRGLLTMLDKVTADASPRLLVDHYAAMLRDRRNVNKSRADALDSAQIAWVFAMVVPFVELGLALATRLLFA